MDNSDQSVLNILTSVLGSYTEKSNDNYAFNCPFCHHRKQKLEIQLGSQYWNCWVCGSKGKSLYTLFKKAGVSSAIIDSLNVVLGKIVKPRYVQEKPTKSVQLMLPDEYNPLWKINSNSFSYNTAINYLKTRGVSDLDILKYHIGYCDSGVYKDMLVFPNYNEFGQLNYFTTRTFMANNRSKFKNPTVSRDVIGFELQLNWQLPLIIVESALDAIIIKRNATPLYGTIMMNSLKKQIIERGVNELYMVLDPDAIMKSIGITKYLIGLGKIVHLVNLPGNEDANSMGYQKIWELINNTQPITNDALLKLETMCKLRGK